MWRIMIHVELCVCGIIYKNSDDNEAVNQQLSEVLDQVKVLSRENMNDPGIKKGTKNLIKQFIQKGIQGSIQSFAKLKAMDVFTCNSKLAFSL